MVVTSNWDRTRGEGILDQITACGVDLQAWGKNQSDEFPKKKKKIQACHNHIQSLKQQSEVSTNRQVLEARKELGKLLAEREDYWK